MAGILGLNNTEDAVNALLIIVIILFILFVAAIVSGIIFYKKRVGKKLAGLRRTDGGRISGTAFEWLEDTEERIYDLTDNVDDLYRRMQKTYQRVGIAKYNAYSGGNVSFVLAMLDECNSGFILNVINGREGSNMYLKEVIEGTCTERLGAEEAHALDIAISSGEI